MGENEEGDAKKRKKKRIKEKWNFMEKGGPKRAQLKSNSEVKKEVKKWMAKTLSRTKLPWGPRGYYEGKPSFRKTTAHQEQRQKHQERGRAEGEERLRRKNQEPTEANTLLAEPGEPRPGADLNCRWQYTRSGPREIGCYANTLLCRDECRIQS
jgi:hypothetical protein